MPDALLVRGEQRTLATQAKAGERTLRQCQRDGMPIPNAETDMTPTAFADQLRKFVVPPPTQKSIATETARPPSPP